MKPHYSLIIPVGLDRTCHVIDSIKNLHYPKDRYEVIIHAGNNPSRNRNKGIRQARGDILVFLDAHSTFEPNLLTQADHFFTQHPDIAIVGGPQLTHPNDTPFGKANGFVLSSWFATHNMSRRYKKTPLTLNADETHLTSALCFIKQSVFTKEKGFNEHLYPAEDPELFTRLKHKGYTIAYTPELFVYHTRRSNLISFFTQLYRYGRTRKIKEHLTGNTLNPLFSAPRAFVLYLTLLLIIFITNLLTPLPSLHLIAYAPLALYILITLLHGISFTFKAKNPLHLLYVPLCFLTLHIAYGLGLLTFIKKEPPIS